ncbi:putative mannosyl-oligosaccharide glucosidase [Zancudomyces culisetae]|uniref:mannosyl-oligosaccharide glucosidase n=1 Tax=Zancudomyces culisetae TaxID=1213189 RepID=A0A1R1PZK1_ZANCU|nr:putative mannosyl-oligosaccharide glucosidase [Zancudomyces culisetae]|eukprot:OMH86393.1 putative mannosyl-oligosaccharide glucosidase [Zancudomyces culisetae]
MARNIKQPEDRWNAKDIFMRELVGNAQRRFAGMSEEQVNRIMTEEHPSSLLKFRKFSLKNSDDYINNSKRNRNGNSDSDDDESDSDDDTDNDDNSSSGDEGGKMWRYNWVAIKISFEGEFEFKIEYSNASKEAASVTHEYKLDEEIVAKRREFDEKFERVFKLQERGYGEKEIGVAKTAFSNVMGGIGVFEGEEIVEEEKSIMAKARDKKGREKQREEAVGDEMKRRAERSVEEDALDRELELDLEMEIEKAQQNSKEKNSSDAAPTSDIKDEKPRIIFTGTPSRTFFPRGFLWDEGFHQLIVSEFDTDLSLLILNSWFDSMDKTSGWISREKIYGEEARSKVPKKFQVQNKHIANPPTLLMPVLKYLNILKQQTMRGSGGKARGMDGAEAVSQGSSGSGSGGVENEDGNDDIMMDPMEKAAINMRKHRQVHLSREQDDNQGQEQEEGFYLNNKEIKSIGKIKLYELYTKLKKNYEWYLNTQSEKIDSVLGYSNIELYKWNQGLKKGAAANRHHLLPSGLDDYPRCDYYYTTEQEVESKEKGNNGGGKTSKPVKRFHEICDGDKSEIDDEERLFLHVDLISWIGFMAKSLYEISDFLGLSADQMLHLEKYNNIKKYLNEIYYNKQKNMYCDIMLTTKTKTAAGTGSDTKKSSKSKIKHVCHKGYISLIPRLLLSPSSVSTAELLGNDIDMLTDPNELWSEFGIRSLSKSNPYYQQGENYWKGPIWVNINYLVLKSLHSGHHQNPHNNQEEKSDLATYNRLKANLVSTIVGSYNKTGNFWEQYNQDTGNGQRSHPFNGWTSLLVLIMADKY